MLLDNQTRTIRASYEESQWRVVRQSVATVTDRETREKAIGDRRRADGCVRENTMGHCCALGTLEQCRLPDSVNNPCLRWGPLLDKNDGGCRGATITRTSVNIHGESFFFEGKDFSLKGTGEDNCLIFLHLDSFNNNIYILPRKIFVSKTSSYKIIWCKNNKIKLLLLDNFLILRSESLTTHYTTIPLKRGYYYAVIKLISYRTDLVNHEASAKSWINASFHAWI